MQYYSKYRGKKKFLSDINVTPFVDVNKYNETFISKKQIASDILNEKLKEIKKANPKTQIYIRADKSVTYDVLMKVMKQIIDSGILNVNLITLPRKWGLFG